MGKVKIATPYSTLMENPVVRERLLSLSDLVELRGIGQAVKISGAALYHCELSVVAPWTEASRDMLRRMAGEAELLAVSFHAASRYRLNNLRDGMFHGYEEPMTHEEMLDHAVQNIYKARQYFGQDVMFLVENNNDLGGDAYATVTDPAFLQELMATCDMELLLDTAHAQISATNRCQAEGDYLAGFDLRSVIQVHLSRPARKPDGKAVDAHDALQDEDWQAFGQLALPRLRWVSVEFYRDANVLCEQLARLRTELARI
ncbi:MAG TPA: DUF692 family protein [Nitratidesulfovibrio sp.]|nr:DUF692 family protein [Nitratidesulfovibrio sp.]